MNMERPARPTSQRDTSSTGTCASADRMATTMISSVDMGGRSPAMPPLR